MGKLRDMLKDFTTYSKGKIDFGKRLTEQGFVLAKSNNQIVF